ncbi:hypothetical protein POM88_027015 [Heracleum sosnowskyi]|uniref:F-box domain-containing protein n=1 Tax=Heracleum sosnowskyi TaxID=360622 RepID=A0AAD8I741_9APIA|nr:hypothetical protein POM88_027015 [Heracleum sosnowskyi]
MQATRKKKETILLTNQDREAIQDELANKATQNLPDELVIEIFTRLNNNDAPFDTLHDLKSLCQCSTVCKRFYSLVFLVRTFNIKHPNGKTLYEHCPKILKNFKHIRSLQVKHSKPYKKFSYYQNLQVRDILMLSDASMESDDDNLHAPTREHAFDLITLHHMLESSINDHNYLQMVVVTNFTNRPGNLHFGEGNVR